MGAGDAAPAEFLIDRAGFLRARWKAGATAGLPSEAKLLAQLDRLKQLPLEEQAHAHAH
jgi:hypothetical protein